ncbi:hypothetical protein N619_00245, partial [Ectopseudomonas oleovorans]
FFLRFFFYYWWRRLFSCIFGLFLYNFLSLDFRWNFSFGCSCLSFTGCCFFWFFGYWLGGWWCSHNLFFGCLWLWGGFHLSCRIV